MPETHRKNPVEGLNATLAGGPFIFSMGARKENASHHLRVDRSLVAQAVQVASGQPEKVRSTLLLAATKLFSNCSGTKIDVSDVSSKSFSEAQNPSF